MEKKIVLITGASSGFGFHTSLYLASKGYHVIATMRDLSKREGLLKVAKEKNIEDNIEILRLDVTNREEIDRVKNRIETTYGRLDILINNAGFCLGGLVEYANIDEWDQQLDTNILSVVAVTKAFIPMMRQMRKGKIINIGSISGRFGFPGMGAYSTSKFALSGFSESLRLELAPFNIKVSIVEPGSFKTNIWEKSINNVDFNYDKSYDLYFNSVLNRAKQTAEDAADPIKVVKLIEKICRINKPRLRYPVGKGIKLMIIMKNILPWSFIEWIILGKLKRK